VWMLLPNVADSAGFAAASALMPALTVLTVPMYAPYNQVLLLPAILWLIREYKSLPPASISSRFIYLITTFALCWQWLASLALSILYLSGRHAEALRAWKLPFYATFALPVLIFALTVIGVQRQLRVLRGRAAPE